VVSRNSELAKKNPNYVSREELIKAEAELQVAEAELAGKQAELAEADLGLEQARRRPGPATAPDRAPAATSPAAGGTLADLRDAVELMEVQFQGRRDATRGPKEKLRSAKALFDARRPLAAEGRVTQSVMLETEAALNAAQAELDQKMSEVLEFEVRLKQAKRRADAEEARLKREAERAKTRLEWVESMAKKGYVASSELEAARARYDDLMFQLDPKYAPVKAPPTTPEERR
jgi:multidrug resistance efflux pump